MLLWKERSVYREVSNANKTLSFAHILAAEVSTLGGITLPGLRKPGPFVGAFLNGILSKLPYESGGGVAAQIYQHYLFNISQKSLRSPPPHT